MIEVFEMIFTSPFSFILLLVLGISREGLRWSLIIGVINECLLQLLKTENEKLIIDSIVPDINALKMLHILSVVLGFASLWCAWSFPTYTQLPLTGKFNVGYTVYTKGEDLNEQKHRFAIYYPTSQDYLE